MAVPAWKLAILERKKKQEAEEKAKQLQAEEAKLASLPAWKRAIILREKQANVHATPAPPPSAPPGSKQVTPLGKVSNKWQEAVERVKGPDSPILHQKSKSYTPSYSSKASSPSPKLATKLQEVDVLVKLSPKVPKKNMVVNRWKPQDPAPQSPQISKKSKPDSAPKADDDQSLARMPAWKKELILRKRRAQQPPEMTSTSNLEGGQGEPDFAIATPNKDKLTVEKHAEPEVVNRAKVEDKEAIGQRLVEQEGKTLHPPIYKEVDEWANVKEEDSKFKDLPLWKQALIKRRRDDIAKRSGLPVTSTPTLPTPPISNSAPTTTATQATDPTSSKKETTPQWKKKRLSSTENKKTANKTKKVTPVTKSSGVQLSKPSNHHIGQTEKSKNVKPVRKAPSVKNDGMFSYNFSKSSHRTLDTGGSSSDSTDSDLEDAVITNLDESDEGDSGIVLQHYSTNGMSSSSPNLNKSLSDSSMNTKSILATFTPGRKKKGTRRVSWDETHFVSEHTYPKYDYSDYEEIQEIQQEANATVSSENLGLSHRVHPSLRPANETDPYSYGFTSPTSSRTAATDSSLGSFVPKTLSSYTPQYTPLSNSTMAEQIAEEPLDQPEQQADDFYGADLTSNTAALLW